MTTDYEQGDCPHQITEAAQADPGGPYTLLCLDCGQVLTLEEA